jgi:hypothetical protein
VSTSDLEKIQKVILEVMEHSWDGRTIVDALYKAGYIVIAIKEED